MTIACRFILGWLLGVALGAFTAYLIRGRALARYRGWFNFLGQVLEEHYAARVDFNPKTWDIGVDFRGAAPAARGHEAD